MKAVSAQAGPAALSDRHHLCRKFQFLVKSASSAGAACASSSFFNSKMQRLAPTRQLR
jgi:hypothetical protein